MMKRPSFAVAWAASQRICSPANPSKKVALIVGGHVAMNIKSPDPGRRWENTCAERMSYILDLYHSKELDAQATKVVIKPSPTDRPDNPSLSKSK